MSKDSMLLRYRGQHDELDREAVVESPQSLLVISNTDYRMKI